MASHGGATAEWDLSGRLVVLAFDGVTRRFDLFGGRIESDATTGAIGALDLGEVSLEPLSGDRTYRHLDFRGNVSFVTDDARAGHQPLPLRPLRRRRTLRIRGRTATLSSASPRSGPSCSSAHGSTIRRSDAFCRRIRSLTLDEPVRLYERKSGRSSSDATGLCRGEGQRRRSRSRRLPRGIVSRSLCYFPPAATVVVVGLRWAAAWSR